MKNANTADSKKKFNGKIAGLTVLEVLFYLFSLPIIVVLSVVFGVRAYELVPYYSFWPFVGVILAGVLCLIFIIVVMCISLRKKSKRTILMQTVSIIVAVIFLTSFIAVALDVVLPDVLAQLTSSTLFYEDLNNQSLASEQAEFNASLDRKFIMLNLLNGNYDPQYEYETLKTDSSVSTRARELGLNIRSVASTQEYENLYLADELFAELYQFIYDEYVMTDMDYALLAPNVQFEDGFYLGNTTRMGMALAIAEAIYPEFRQLAEEGMSNERIAYLYQNNYASLKNDGYLTYDDSMILYATTGRMTVPVVIRLLLDRGYTYTEGEQAYIENGEVVEPEGTFYLELYEKEDVIAIMEDEDAVEWNSDGTRGVLVKEVEGVDYGVGAVVIPTYDENGTLIGGYIRAPRQWSILDMDGKNMDVAALSDVVVDLGSLLGGLLEGVDLGGLESLINQVLRPMTLGELLNTLNGIVPALLDESLFSVVDKLLQGVTDVIMAATGGSGLYLNLAINDQGALEIAIAPTNVEVGMHGYQYMTWMESNNLLFAVMGVMSLREWLYIFGAVSVLLAFAAGMCREIKARVRKDMADNEELEAENEAAGEGETFESGAAEYDAETPAADIEATDPVPEPAE